MGGWDNGLLPDHILFLFSLERESRSENIKRTFCLTKVFCVM
jgi:hypothetical protein